LLGLGELLHPQRKRGAFEVSAAGGWKRRMLWHGACHQMSIAPITILPKERPSRSGVN
jgi:hypothetical protein